MRERPDDPSSRLVATELVTTSIGSRGDASDSRDEIDAVLVSRLASRCACASFVMADREPSLRQV